MIQKQSYAVLCIVMLLIVCGSCTHQEPQLFSSLLQADSLMKHRQAQTALDVLCAIPQDSLLTAADRGYYALLRTQAEDKNYIRHQSDSLMKIAVAYFSKSGNDSMRAKAHYYLGRVYQDMEHTEASVAEYLTAASELGQEATELSCLLYSNLGFLFYEHGLLQEADSLYTRAWQAAIETKDVRRQARALCNKGDIARKKGEKHYKQALTYLTQAFALIENEDYIQLKRSIATSLGDIYQQNGELYEAIDWGKYALKMKPNLARENGLYLLLGKAYADLDQHDSARHYLNKSITSTDYGTRRGACIWLADIAEKEGNTTEALRMTQLSIVYGDSARTYEQPVKLVSSAKDVIQQQIINHYESTLSARQKYLIATLVLIIVLIALIEYRHQTEKRKFKQVKERLDTLTTNEKKIKEKLYGLEELVNQYNINKQQVTLSIREMLTEKERSEQQLTELLNQKNKLIETLSKHQFNTLISETPIHQKIAKIKANNRVSSNKIYMTDEDWEEFTDQINLFMPHFIATLKKNYPEIKKEDIYFLCLVKLDTKFSEMQYIFGCTADAVYKRAKTIKKRMNLPVDEKLKEILLEI